MTKLAPILLAVLILAAPAVRAEDAADAPKAPAKEAPAKKAKAAKAEKKEEAKADKDEASEDPGPIDPGTQEKIENGIHQLQTSLDLDDVQRDKMRAIISRSVKETQIELTRMRNRLESLKVRTANDIRAILNDKQKAKYDELQAKNDAAQQAAMMNRMGGAAPSASSVPSK